MTDHANVDQSTTAPRLWVEFTGLGVFVLDQKKPKLDILMIDAGRANVVPHRPVLMAPFETVHIDIGFEIPTVVTIGATRVAIWDLTGRDLTFSDPPNTVASMTFPIGLETAGSMPEPINDTNAWNNLRWLVDLHAVCGATQIAHPELVTASASFTSGSMFVGMPSVHPGGLFRFDGVPAVPDRLYSDRGGCVCPMNAAGVTLTLTNRTDQSPPSKIRLVPDRGGDLHVAIANYAEHETMRMSTGQMPTEQMLTDNMLADHFVAYYELLGSKTQPRLVLISRNDAPSFRCLPPVLMLPRE